MSWSELPTWWRTIAEEVCTEKELEVLHLIAAGMSLNQISVTLNISRSSVQSRYWNAKRKVINHPDYDDRKDPLL